MCRWLVVLALAGPGLAQQMMSVRVFSDPPGARFQVDGERYVSSAVFLWPEFSKHLLFAESPFQVANSLYAFKEWHDSREDKLQDGALISITATRDVTSYRALYRMFYEVRLSFYSGTANLPFACRPGPEWGKIYINIPDDQSCYASDAVLWQEAGKSVRVQAYAPAGWVFRGWHQPIFGSQAGSVNFVLDRPVLLAPIFELAARVRLETSPPALQLLADRTTITTPLTMDWAAGTDHAVGALSPQRDLEGAPWVFESWSDTGEQYHSYTAGQVNSLAALTARYAPGVSFGFRTNPDGLQLVVDGRSNWPGYNFIWAAGSRHTVTAPAEQADARGRRYLFRNWAHGGEATQEMVAREHGGWIANYEQLGRLTIRTRPEDVAIKVDGEACNSPCTVDRRVGTEVQIEAPATAALREDTRMEFQAWADGASPSRSFQMVSEASLTADYRMSYRLQTGVEPPGGAALRCQPESGDGYYPQGAVVLAVADPAAGYRFLHWEGDLTGNLRSGTIRMTAPRRVRAMLARLPAVVPVVVQNAAGETPEAGLAAGSLISIYGAELAEAELTGPNNPLVQTLGGVAVQAGGRLFPLLFVSPGLINAQLPAALSGEYELTVVREGHPDQKAPFRAVRNAPGLFAVSGGFAVALHEDGALLSPEAPARAGETITLLGTGFGPYQASLPDGFPALAPLPLLDPVEILIGSQRLEPLSAAAAPGQTGVVAVRLRLPEPLDGPQVELKVVANGKESNTVRINVATPQP